MTVMFPEVHARAHALAVELLSARTSRGDWVMDCGTGDRALADALERAGLRVLALDPAGGRGVVRGGWEALPVRADSMAAVTACASLQYAEDPRAAVTAAAAALRPGGTLLVLLSPVHGSEEGARKGERTARQRTGNPRYRHFSKAEVERYFRDAGLGFELRPTRLAGAIGLKRRLKAAAGVELASFPTLVGVKPAR